MYIKGYYISLLREKKIIFQISLSLRKKSLWNISIPFEVISNSPVHIFEKDQLLENDNAQSFKYMLFYKA